MTVINMDPSGEGKGPEDENTGLACIQMEVMGHVRKRSLANHPKSYTAHKHLK